jgi:beta-mannosidase
MRKYPYQFGWDWASKFVTKGIWRPVRLEMWDEVRISDLHIEQQSASKARAIASAEVEMEASATMRTDLQIRITAPDRVVRIASPCELNPRAEVSERLWQNDRYSVSVVISNSQGVAVVRAHVKTGLRSVELRRDPDKWGTSFESVVNGIPVFVQGANVIPFDSFPSRVTLAQQRRRVRLRPHRTVEDRTAKRMTSDKSSVRT